MQLNRGWTPNIWITNWIGWELDMEDWPKDNLWDLLQWQELQLNLLKLKIVKNEKKQFDELDLMGDLDDSTNHAMKLWHKCR